MNVITPALFLASILTFLWPHLRGTGAHVTLALLYGASIGGFVALFSVPMIALGDSTDVGRRTGMYLTVLSLCSLAGPPISGAIYRSTGGYSGVGIYAGQFTLFYFRLSEHWMSHTRIRIYDDDLRGTPRSDSILCTKKMERESIEAKIRVFMAPFVALSSHIVSRTIADAADV